MTEKLPCPSFYDSSFQETKPSIDNKCNVDKVRSFPHERNQWSTHVFLEVDPDALDTVLDLCDDEEIVKCDSLHLSLSSGHNVLRYHQIDGFCHALTEHIKHISPFYICLDKFQLLSNEDETRLFICLCDSSADSKKQDELFSAISRALNEFQCQIIKPQYEKPVMHVAAFWCLPQFRDKALHLINELQTSLEEPLLIYVSQITLKVGHIVKRFNLG